MGTNHTPALRTLCGSMIAVSLLVACTEGHKVTRRAEDASMMTDAGTTPVGPECAGDELECGNTCCSPFEACARPDVCILDCRSLEACGDTCCVVGTECRSGACMPLCDVERRCGADAELCCAEGEACLGGACLEPGDACVISAECPDDQICEPTLQRCVPRSSVTACEYRPPVGVFEPVMTCRWQPQSGDPLPTSNGSITTPVVANVTDDNGDGVTDMNDMPDIIFGSNAGGGFGQVAAIRIASYCDEFGQMATLGTIDSPLVDGSGGIAVGNLDLDTNTAAHVPEIVAFTSGGVAAFRRALPDGSRWDLMWHLEGTVVTSRANNAGQVSIADLDSDGYPEVFLGNLVIDGLTGTVKWDGFETVGAGAGIGQNAFLGPTSTAADIDLDGVMELIAGNTVYDGRDGSEKWTFTYPDDGTGCASSFRCDGYNAIGNFDGDDEAEIVAVRAGQLYVFEHDGAVKHMVEIPVSTCTRNEGGPPTVADFDGDGRAEIGVAAANFYTVFDFDCTGETLPAECDSENVRWKVPNRDCSSRATGSSVFDFEGDGRAEVIYADEQSFRIFDGSTGEILFSDDEHRSNTRMEMPIVVDFDNDGKSEILVPEPSNWGATRPGIQVWEDRLNNWVRTRRIWNQHSYHVTNVTEDGQIPRIEAPNWTQSHLNNFRQNVQGDGLFDAPDLQILAVELGDCSPGGRIRIDVLVANAGALGVPAGLPVVAEATTDTGEVIDLGTQIIAGSLLPGQRARVEFVLERPPDDFEFDSLSVQASVDVIDEHHECDESNNTLSSGTVMVCTLM